MQVDLPAKTTETSTLRTVKLCSDAEVGDLFGWIACDLPTGHKGPHRGTVYWGDEDDA